MQRQTAARLLAARRRGGAFTQHGRKYAAGKATVMPDTHIVNLSDLQATKMRAFSSDVVRAATSTRSTEHISGIACRRRPGNRPCLGTIAVHKAELPGPFIFWECTECADNGRIAGFQGSPDDLSAVSKSMVDHDGQRRDVTVTAAEYRAWIAGDMIPYGLESMQIMYSAVAQRRGVHMSAPEDDLETLLEATVADINHESNKKRKAHLTSLYDKLSETLHPQKKRKSPGRQTKRPSKKIAAPTILADSAYAHGFFCALIAGPMVMPTHWLQRFLSPGHKSIEDLNTDAQRVMEVYNDVAYQLSERRERFGDATRAIAKCDATGQALIDWKDGFLEATELNPDEWMALFTKQGKEFLQPLAMISQFAEDPSKRSWLADQGLREDLGRSLAVITARLWESYRNAPFVELQFQRGIERRAEPKVSRNAACPCGSGKKYKKCCGPDLHAV